jgi:CRP-like cAMP-binding protein
MKERRNRQISISRRAAILERSKVLAGITASSLQALATNAKPLRLGKGAVLWHEGDSARQMVCIVHGALLTQRTDGEGHTVYYRIVKANELAGYASLANRLGHSARGSAEPVHHVTTTAREDSLVLLMASSVVRQVGAKEPDLLHRLIAELSDHARGLADIIFDERVRSGKFLLAAHLLRMAAMEGVFEGHVYLRYSQLELTRFTGMGARNINKFLRELPAVRTVNGRRGVQIERIEALRDFLCKA